MESQRPLHGRRQGSLHQTIEQRISKHYASLETLHSSVPQGAPVLATSATMPPITLEGVRPILGANAERLFHLNLGNDRHNVVPLVSPIEGGKSNLSARFRWPWGGIVTDDYLFQRQMSYHVPMKLPSNDAPLFTRSPRESSGVCGWPPLRGRRRSPQCHCSGEDCVPYVGVRPETFR